MKAIFEKPQKDKNHASQNGIMQNVISQNIDMCAGKEVPFPGCWVKGKYVLLSVGIVMVFVILTGILCLQE